jgi:hypothetical protein
MAKPKAADAAPFALLAEAIASRPPAWTHGHATRWIAPMIRKGFAADAEHAAKRFAGYFTDKAVSTDEGAQIAASIWMLGMATLTRHQVIVETRDPKWLHLDPGWFPIAARLIEHKRLGRLAKSVLALLPKKQRTDVMEKNPPSDAEPAPKKRSKKIVYKAGQRVRSFGSDDDWRGSIVTLAEVTASGHVRIATKRGPGPFLGPGNIRPLDD